MTREEKEYIINKLLKGDLVIEDFWEFLDDVQFLDEVRTDYLGEGSDYGLMSARTILQDPKEAKFYALEWERANGKFIDNNFDDYEFYEVIPQEVTTIEYVKKENK